MAINGGTVFINVLANVGPFRQQMLGLGSQLSQFGSTVSRVGVGLSRAVTLPLAIAGAAAVKLAVDYDAAFARISAVTNQSSEDIARWKEQLLTLAGKTGRAPQELADALYFVSSAGLDVSQIMPVMTEAAKASAVGLGEVGTVAKLVTNAVNAYSSSGLKAADVTDTLVAAVREGTAEPSEFADAMGRILPIASKAGVEFQNVAASLAVVSNIGLDVNEGVTAMRGLLKALLVPGTQAAETLGKIGLSANDVRRQLSQEGLLGVVETLEKRTKAEFGKGWLDAINKIIPNIRALTGALGLTVQESNKVQGIFDSVTHSTGDLGKAFGEIQKNNPQFQFQQMLAKLKALGIELGEQILPILLQLGDQLITLVKAFSNLSDGTKEWIVKMAGIAFVAGPVLRIFGGLIGAVTGLGKAFVFLAGLGPKVIGFFAGTTAAAEGTAAATAAAGEGVAATGAAGAAGAAGALTTGLGAILGGAAVAAGISVTNRLFDDLAVTEGELSKQTGITVDNIEALYGQLNNGAYWLNIFGSREDQARKAGEIYNAVLKDMVKSGYSVSRAQDVLNSVFQDSLHDIGGVTGSMDTLEQNLRARVGFLETTDAVKLFQRHFNDLNEAINKTDDSFGAMTERLGGEVTRALAPGTLANFRAALISIEDSNLNIAKIISGPVHDALVSGEIDWTQLNEAAGRFDLPFAQAGDWVAQMLNMSEGTFRAKNQLADFIALAASTPGINPHEWRTFNTLLHDAAFGSGTLSEAWDSLAQDIMPQIGARLGDVAEGLTTVQIKTLAAKIADEDWVAVLKQLNVIEQKRQDREDKRKGLPTTDIQKQVAEMNELFNLTTEFGKKWGALLAAPKGIIDPQTITEISGLIKQIDFSELTKAQKVRLQVALETGDTMKILKTILSILKQIDKKHVSKIEADARQAQTQLATIAREGTGWANSTFTAKVNADTSQATSAMSHFIETWNGRTVNIMVGVTTPSELTKIHQGGLLFHGGGEVPAILQRGEYVLRRSAVDRIGRKALDAMNAGTQHVISSNPESDLNVNVTLDRRRVLQTLDYGDRYRGW